MNEIELPEGMEEKELLNLLTAQREAAIGFDQDRELNEDRARALDYYKGLHEGYVQKDLPVSGNSRSKVVTSEVADMVETSLPDLMEIFTNGDDVLTFRPVGDEDEDAAEQESDYVRHVFFNENDGWMLLYNAFKDALISKTGIFKFYWDIDPEYEEYETEVDEMGLQELQALGLELVDQSEPDEMGIRQVTVAKMVRDGRIVVENVAPEDFAVTRYHGQVSLRDADYVAHRTRVTLQDLRARGYDEDLLATLHEAEDHDEDVDYARDVAYENQDEEDPGSDDLKEVEVIEHYIRLDSQKDGDTQLYRIVTGNHERVILELEKRAQVEFAAICPFPMPHRFYGQSVADKTVPIQKWKTSLSRLANDAYAFSLHARTEVAKDELVPGMTLEQLADHSPGKHIVTRSGNGLKQHDSNANPGDYLTMLEYVSTVAESRTGIARNAQGLNPDTLHDTKGGAEILIGAAQKRVRLMARLFAETGLRDLFMGIHELLRSNATMRQTARLKGKWVPVDPSSWKRRNDMDIHIGVGSGGRQQELQAVREFSQVLTSLVELQGGPTGPVVTPQGIYAFADHYGDRLGIRGVERFITDPEPAMQQQAMQPPQPDPEMQAQMAEMQRKQQEFMAKMSLEQQKAYLKAQTDQMKMEMEGKLAVRQQDMEAQLRREEATNPNIRPVDFGGQTG
jgi:hypothetical protein